MARIRGTDAGDIFSGTSGDDQFWGYLGNDNFFGSSGNDYFNGGEDRDAVHYGHSGAVTVDLQTGVAYKNHGQERDTLVSIEDVYGSAYNDTLKGDDNDNRLSGEGGRDSLYGRGGQDTLVADIDDIIVDGGDGVDTLAILAPTPPDQFYYIPGYETMTVTLNNDGSGTAVWGPKTLQLRDIENVTVRGQADAVTVELFGNNQDNKLSGADGSDRMDGGDGSDVLTGGGSLDVFVFNHGTGSNTTHNHQHDIITDFQPGIDRISLRDTRVQSFADLGDGGDRSWVDTSAGTLIHTSADHDTSILLQGVHVSSLTADDFVF
jgi:Ca2+-binding RTX toxin-like protein